MLIGPQIMSTTSSDFEVFRELHMSYIIILLALSPWNSFICALKLQNLWVFQKSVLFCFSWRISSNHFEGQKFISGHFCGIEKAHIAAMSWTGIDSAWPPLSILKIEPDGTRCKKLISDQSWAAIMLHIAYIDIYKRF